MFSFIISESTNNCRLERMEFESLVDMVNGPEIKQEPDPIAVQGLTRSMANIGKGILIFSNMKVYSSLYMITSFLQY